MITDAIGRAVAFVLTPGQGHELPHAIPLLDKLPDVPKWVVADRGYSSHAFREHIGTHIARMAVAGSQILRNTGPAVISAAANQRSTARTGQSSVSP